MDDNEGKSFTSTGYVDNFFSKSLFPLADKEGIANKIFLAFLLSIIFFNSLKA